MEWGEASGMVVGARRVHQRYVPGRLESWEHPENFGNLSELALGDSEGEGHGYHHDGYQKVS